MKRAIILGGGIAGLTAAWTLKKHLKESIDITLIEKQNRVGGWIETVHEQGFCFERGARGCRYHPNTLALVKELGLNNELIWSHKEAKKRYLGLNGQLVPLPSSPFALFTSPLCKGVIPTLFKERKIPKTTLEDESIESFILRRFSKPILDNFIDPLVKGIFAGDPKNLSMRACFPKMWAMEEQYGSLVKGLFAKKKDPNQRRGLFAFKNGMQTLPDMLEKKLKKLSVHFALEKEVTQIHNDAVTTSSGQTYKGDILISALPLKALAPLVQVPLFEQEQKTLAIVNLGYKTPINKPKGFGFLIPSSQNQQILGITFDSDIFPHRAPPNGTSLTVMLPNKDPIQKALEGAHHYLNISKDPDIIHLKVAKQAIAQYAPGHTKKVQALRKSLPHLILVGSSFDGVGINDSILSATSQVSLFF